MLQAQTLDDWQKGYDLMQQGHCRTAKLELADDADTLKTYIAVYERCIDQLAPGAQCANEFDEVKEAHKTFGDTAEQVEIYCQS